MPETSVPATTLQLAGAIGFGALIGWYLYYINRYRTSQVDLADLVTVIGAIGGGAILVLFPARSDLFGAYGIGLALGFFGYFIVLTIMVSLTRNFSVEFFLDGRRKKPADDEIMPGYNPANPSDLPRNTVMGESSTSGSQGGPLS
jgi:hypothetical protein